MDSYLETILGRLENDELVDTLKKKDAFFKGRNILITGSEGSLGLALQDYLRWCEANVIGADIVGTPTVTASITDNFGMTILFDHVYRKGYPLDYIFHLAADKHAPHGEQVPQNTVKINIEGMQNVMSRFKSGHFILASTCKAADPETVYGATKMIAERIVLDSGGSVSRFYNVPESQGNVFEIWEDSPEPLPVMQCKRYFISRNEAIALMVNVAKMEPGRYTVNDVKQREMLQLANGLYPNKTKRLVSPRRGDRVVEPLIAKSEYLTDAAPGIVQIHSEHDKREEDTY